MRRIIFSEEIITPDVAREMLKNKAKNRSVRKAAMMRIADDIERGEWVLTHQGIALDADGNVIDGEHRLNAIVAADVACEVVIARYVDNEHAIRARARLDINSKRDHGDMLMILDKVSDAGKERVAVARMILSAQESGDHRYGPALEEECVLKYADDYTALRAVYQRKIAAPHFSAFVWIRRLNPEAVEQLLGRLYSGVGLTPTEAVLSRALEERIPGGTLDRVLFMHKVLRGIETVLNGETIVKLQMPSSLATSTVFDRISRKIEDRTAQRKKRTPRS